MTNRKRNLIDALYGSFMFMDNLPELISQETIYDEKGYVDIEFMTAILEWMSRMATISVNIQKELKKLLGVEEVDLNNKKNKNDSGMKWSVEDILKHCTLENNVIKLPAVQFNKKSYAEAKKWIEEAGGSWTGGKVQGFTFPVNAERVFSVLHEGKRCNLQQDFQFFETPAEVADWLVMLAGGIKEGERVLEPSAGRGAIVDAIHRNCVNVVVDCCEMMPENKEILRKKENIQILGDDFTGIEIGMYDKIVANPPFSKNQDVRHVKRMYEHLSEGGTLAAIMSKHWIIAAEKECEDFRRWLEERGGKRFEIESGAFKESGTMIDTVAVVIHK